MTEYNDSCWQDLANAIVLSAVDDWRRSKFQLAHPSLASKRALDMTRSCERFFCSSYFRMLTGLNGNALLDKMKKVMGCNNEYKRIGGYAANVRR